MKKSFMTRVLASGLSLAMAFSLSAATNVTTAAAASKPTMIDYQSGGSAKTLSVKLGEATKIKVNAATKKTYKVSAVKVSSNKLRAAKNKAGTVVTIRGLKATEEGKPAAVKVSFKVRKTGKTSKYSYASKVNVIEDKLTMTAEATHVKEIVVTANKAFADPTKVTATVKKGTADRGATATVEGSKITLAMDAKLTKGSYTITVEGAEDTPITVPCEVAQDETLDTFWIGDYIVAKSATDTTTGYIKYAALNQYGDKMVTNEPTVTCSFGTVLNQKPKTVATATAEGVIEVTNINPVLAIVGNKGTVVLVGDMGINATKEISYNTFAKATTGEVIGTYHKNSAELKTITEGDKIEDYELLLSLKDQYGYSIGADDDALNGVSVTVAGGLTNINLVNATDFKTRTYKDTDYVAIDLKAAASTGVKSKAVAGSAPILVVNSFAGQIINETITVAENVIIKNIAITADNGVYEGDSNEMSYEFIDAEGKPVTSYATLKNCINLDTDNTGLRFEQKSDGSAKLIFEPKVFVNTANTTTDKNTTVAVVTVYANQQTSADYLPKTLTFTVYQSRYAKGVTGIDASVTKSFSLKDKTMKEIPSTKLILADQYSNKVTYADDKKIFNTKLFNEVSQPNATGTAVYIATGNAIEATVSGNSIVVTPAAVGTATVYLKYDYTADSKVVTAGATSYDAKFPITVYDTTSVDTDSFEITVNDGFDVTEADAKTLDTSKVTVKALIGGEKTTIPESQYTIAKNENNTFNKEDETKGVNRKEATVTVQITTWDAANTPISTQVPAKYMVSKEDAKLYKVTDVVDTAPSDVKPTTTGAAVTAAAFVKCFNFKTQFGVATDGAITKVTGSAVKYTIEMVSCDKDAQYEILHNGLNKAQITFNTKGKYIYKVTAITEDGSKKSITVTFTIS